ncbi:glycosyltransferase family 4 protein [Rhizorhabdus dicambivorans]|uniref:Glycosyltransferase family 1 protein n=1 Tax=Rhizorhabdus dicambivorans TaxID=1850238 RepID=A0A2A4G2A4_9SPHN|nr:glycosyltransferase family 1 protein [Rhizorhabdus dicambivorans]ATE64882.1 glycosyltransferase family 1 protein [Rhizorhabdus dicambivorans]PCE44156.1 glycosyltransferase family 1 protein [Rhizorhabdus dicambivorans]
MRIAIATDAWAPQVNGVVRTLQSVTAELVAMGHDVCVIAPDQFRTLPCPSYPEIRLALTTHFGVGRRIAEFGAEAIHIATEGPIGLAARRHCLSRRFLFTTAYHTQFPDYVAERTGMPADWFWHYMRWFHGPSSAVLASTPSVEAILRARGVGPVRRWGRGVDLDLFTAGRAGHPALANLPRPVQLYVGRVAVEKNIEAFLACDVSGSKVVVGDGPARVALARAYPNVRFLGALHGEELASTYAGADVFVFPSRTDTFGLVMIEALACGTPVAAYPVTGPIDVLDPASSGMDENLGVAIARALACDRAAAAAYGATFGWRRSAEQFLDALIPQGEGKKRLSA